MRSESEVTLHKICILYSQPQQEQYRFNCIVIPLLSHMLSSETEACIVLWNKLSVPCWRKSIPHCCL